MSETPEFAKTAAETINGLWQHHGLERVQHQLALDATITAQTLMAGAAPEAAAQRLAVAAPESSTENRLTASLPRLPMIALSGATASGVAHAKGGAKDPGPLASAERADLEAKGVLGEGGMGRVLLANQRSLQRDVAVKVLKEDAITPGVIRALLIEALTAGSLEHPNIIPIHALGTDHVGHPLLVMKRVDGVSWRAVLSDPAHRAWKQLEETTSDRMVASITVLMEVCNAVQYAHERSIIHRDIKPENVMLGAQGEVYLVDWGIAVRQRDEPTTALVGTPCYMAPEMLSGETTAVDARTDVYLLGATLHEVLTGKPRHSGETLYATILAAFESVPYVYGPEVPTELATLANRACSASPAERPQTVRDFRRALAEWVRHRASATLASATAQRATALQTVSVLAKQGDSAARASFDRLATESRFGFTQALKEWPENPVATEGLKRCLTLMIELEIARENPENARSILSEMSGDSAALTDRVVALEKELEQRKQAGQHAAHLARELDDSVAIRERTIMMIALLGLGASITGYMAIREGFQAVTVKTSLKFGAIAFTMMSLAIILLRKKLLSNAFNRRVVSVVLIAFSSMLVHRALALVRGAQMISDVLADDLLIMSAAVVLAGITIQRWFVVVGLVLIGTSVMISFFPAKASLLFSLGPFLAIFVGIVLHRKTFGIGAKSDSARSNGG